MWRALHMASYGARLHQLMLRPRTPTFQLAFLDQYSGDPPAGGSPAWCALHRDDDELRMPPMGHPQFVVVVFVVPIHSFWRRCTREFVLFYEVTHPGGRRRLRESLSPFTRLRYFLNPPPGGRRQLSGNPFRISTIRFLFGGPTPGRRGAGKGKFG